jgi:hypothetical protein
MKTIYKIAIILFLIPLAISATERKGKFTKKKVIKKEYLVNKDATLNVTNKFGNIEIVTNTSNKIEIIVNITTNGDHEEKVLQRLNEITVAFESGSNTVSAETIIKKSTNSWNIWGNKNNVNMEINYIIKMPVTNNVKLQNDYGAINLDKIEGSATINCDYGSLNLGELLNNNNKINIDYNNKSNIEYLKNGVVNADYSTLHIEKTGNIQLNADYSNISFGTINSLDYNCDYGDLKIGTINNVNANCDYMNTTIEKLNGSATFNIDYGALKINGFAQNFKQLTVESSYTQIKLGVNTNNSFNIEASLSYGNLKSNDNFTFNKEISKSSSKYYEGFYNSSNANSKMVLNTNYGNITFTNN